METCSLNLANYFYFFAASEMTSFLVTRASYYYDELQPWQAFVARCCKRTMPCLRPRNDMPTCKEVGYDEKTDPCGVACCVGWFAICAASLAYLIYWIVMWAK